MFENIKPGDDVVREIPAALNASGRVTTPAFSQFGKVTNVWPDSIRAMINIQKGRRAAMVFDRKTGNHVHGPQYGKLVMAEQIDSLPVATSSNWIPPVGQDC